MKFTKEEAFESLKGILTNNGKKTLRMSEKSINKQLESLIPLVANDDMELNDFVDKVKDTFGVMNSNVEKDNSDFVKQWEKEHPTKPVNQETKKDDEPTPNNEMSALKKRLDELEQREAQREKERTISDKRTQLLKAMRDKGIKDEEWSKAFVSEIAIVDDMDIDAKADSFLKLYNKSKASSAGDGGATPKDTSGSGNKDKKHIFDYIKDEYARENKEN